MFLIGGIVTVIINKHGKKFLKDSFSEIEGLFCMAFLY